MAVFETRGNLKAARQALLSVAGVAFVEAELLPEIEPVKAVPVTVRPRQDGSKVDPLRKDQWYLDTMGVPSVWAAGRATKSVTVAVVDTGVDLKHPDLQGKLVKGWNAADPASPPQDAQGHGTMCAGLVGAVADNAQGIAGVAPNAKIMPVKVGNSASSVVDAMMWAADNADMITMSLSFKPNMSQYPTAVQTTKRAAEYVMSKGVPMVCSMGNTGTSSKNVPSAFAGNEVPNLIAVGATDKNDRVTSFSTFGNWCSVSAPGASIVTTAMGGGYKAVDGTSFSTPLTAGVVALMLGAGVEKDPSVIKKRLQETAVDIGAPGYDEKAGAGRVDAAKAVL
jgi:subtilisin family serine protease